MTKLRKNKSYYEDANRTAQNISKEIEDGLKILNKVDRKIVTIFGSHAVQQTGKYYKHCEETAYQLGLKKYAIVTGGGPGIMEAANTGATRAKTISIGFKAKLLRKEQHGKDNIFTEQFSFTFLLARRFSLAIKSNALIFYPGGYGTLNELFEYLTLIQTGMTDPVPLICVHKKYWDGMFDWLKNHTLKEGFINKEQLNHIYFADTPKEVVKIIDKKR